MGAGGGSVPSPFGMPGFTPGQPPPNPEQLLSILDNPMMSQMMQQMVDSNPDMLRGMIEQQNPMFRQMFGGDNERANQFIRQMMNPQALRQMVQLQQAMGGGAGGMFGMPLPTSGGGGGGSAAGSSGTHGLDFSNILADSAASGSRGTASPFDFGSFMQQMQTSSGGANPWGAMQQPPIDFGTMFQQMQTAGTGAGAPAGGSLPSTHPADRYRSQLASLRDMGFDDEQASLVALQQNHGNLNRAVDHLLMGPPTLATSTTVPSSTPSSTQQPEEPSGAPPAAEEEDNSTPKRSEEKKND